MIFTSLFSSLFKSHLFQHLRNFKNHRFLEVLIFHIPLSSSQSPLESVTPISRLPTHCRRVFMVRRQRSPLPLEARLSKKTTFQIWVFFEFQGFPFVFCLFYQCLRNTEMHDFPMFLNGIQKMHDFKFKAFLQYHRFLLVF